jgi:hypothetical protein
MPKEWEQHFPNLGDWQETSPATETYNCFAFAAGENSRNWDPFPPGMYYWPPNVPRSYNTDAYVQAYRTIGYEPCTDGSLEPQHQKIVMYTNEYGGVEHVARQLPDGKWTSKLGVEEDIVHETPQSLSVGYGQPTHFMRRATSTINASSSNDDPSPAPVRGHQAQRPRGERKTRTKGLSYIWIAGEHQRPPQRP